MAKNVVVTGAGKGLGYSIAKRHLEFGDAVYVLEYSITDALKELGQKYNNLTIKECNLGSDESVKNAMEALINSKVPVDLVYNVAGVHFPGDRVPLEETDFDQCITLYNINAIGPLRVLAQVVKNLHSGSVIMNITSESGSVADCTRPFEYGYNMSKSAANMGSKTFSNQMKDAGVRVFCIHPGWLKTDMGGEEAKQSPTAITADESAEAITGIALDAENIPKNIMYLDYRRTPLNW